MTKAPVDLQDLRRRIYVKAKAEPSWRFWGLYVHVCKTETLYEAYRLAKKNNGAPGIDGVTFEAIEALVSRVRSHDNILAVYSLGGEAWPITPDRSFWNGPNA